MTRQIIQIVSKQKEPTEDFFKKVKPYDLLCITGTSAIYVQNYHTGTSRSITAESFYRNMSCFTVRFISPDIPLLFQPGESLFYDDSNIDLKFRAIVTNVELTYYHGKEIYQYKAIESMDTENTEDETPITVTFTNDVVYTPGNDPEHCTVFLSSTKEPAMAR